jgi:glycosyltransferase involved in cell wall biosynthesis
MSHLRSVAERACAEQAKCSEAEVDTAAAAALVNHCDYSLAVPTMRLSALLGLPFACLNHLFMYRLLRMQRWSCGTKARRSLLNSLPQQTRFFLRRWLLPCLGRLQHHPPIALQVPSRYLMTKCATGRVPTISIVTPSLNQGKYLERSVRSVLAQNYPKLEYIIQDGGSTDGTDFVLKRLGSLVHHIESCKDRGQAHAINLGFTHTTGEIMAWLNSDDILLPGAVNYIANFFLKNPNVDVVYGHRILIDEEDREIGRWVLPKHDSEILRWADFIPQETLFWRRRTWECAGGCVDENLQFAIDWDMLLRFKLSGARFTRVPRFIGAFRVHSTQKTLSLFEELGRAEVNVLHERYYGRVPSNDEIERHIRSYLTRSILYDNLYRIGILPY